MATAMSVLGKRHRTIGVAMDTDAVVDGNTEQRQRSEALEVLSTVDLEVVKEHAHLWDPEL